MRTTSELRNPIGRLTLALIAIHSTAALELVLAIGRRGSDSVPGWIELLSVWAGSMLVAATLFGVLYVFILAMLRILHRETGLPAVAATAAVAAFSILFATFISNAVSMLLDPVRGVIVLAVAFSTAAIVYLAARGITAETPESLRVVKALFITPIALTLWLILMWLQPSYLRPTFVLNRPAFSGLIPLLIVAAAGFFGWRRDLSRFVPRFLSAWSVVLMAALAWYALAPEPGMRKFTASASGDQAIRHVILITIDTLRADALSQELSPYCESPNLDALASDSVRFESAYSASPWTPPSVASILNGLSPTVHGVNRRRTHFPAAPPTLPDFFREAGYLTAAFGGNPLLTPQHPLFRNSDVFQFPGPPPPRTLAVQAVRWYLGPIRTSDQHRTEDITTVAKEWIRLHADQDFFLWLHYFDPHAPYLPPPEFLADHNQKRLYRVALAFDEDRGVARLSPPPVARQAMLRGLYCGEVQYVDDRIGRIMKDLKQRNMYDDALIVVTSDHGEEFWEHGNAFHGHSMLDVLLRVPLFFKLPGQSIRTTIPESVSNVAVMPSILDLAEIDFDPTQFSHQPLTRFWDGQPATAESSPVFAGHNFLGMEQEAVISDGWKYIEYANPKMNQLFNLTEDPEERVNRLPSEPEIAEQLHTLIEKHHETSRVLRRRIGGIEGQTPLHMEQEMQRRLKSLGYIQ